MTIRKDETLIYWTVCVVNIIILKVIFGLGKWPQPRPRPQGFGLGLVIGLEGLSSASASRICPHLTSLALSLFIGVIRLYITSMSWREFTIKSAFQFQSATVKFSIHTVNKTDLKLHSLLTAMSLSVHCRWRMHLQTKTDCLVAGMSSSKQPKEYTQKHKI